MDTKIFRALVALLAGFTVAWAWSEAPAREASPPPAVVQELDRMTEADSPPEHPDSGRHFEAKKRERLIQMLQLDEATRAKMLQRFEQLDQKAEDLRRQRREAFFALREQAKALRGGMRRGERRPEAGDKAPGGAIQNEGIRAALDRVYGIEEAMAGLRRERLQVARDLLTPEQQVKFLMYSIKFQKEMRERLEREQQGRHGRLRAEDGEEREKP